MKYPRTFWRLLPSFKPAEVVIAKVENSFDQPFLVSETGKWFRPSELYETRDAAIRGGYQSLEDQQANVAKLQAGIDKKRAALRKAEAS